MHCYPTEKRALLQQASWMFSTLLWALVLQAWQRPGD
jgi:hypothetical protein